jgi:hypothetical protein
MEEMAFHTFHMDDEAARELQWMVPQLGSWLLFRRLPSDIPGTFDK